MFAAGTPIQTGPLGEFTTLLKLSSCFREEILFLITDMIAASRSGYSRKYTLMTEYFLYRKVQPMDKPQIQKF